MGTHKVRQDAGRAFVPTSVVTKPAGHAALKEGFEQFFALPEHVVRNREKKGR